MGAGSSAAMPPPHQSRPIANAIDRAIFLDISLRKHEIAVMIFGMTPVSEGYRESRTNAIAARGARRVDNQSECFEAQGRIFYLNPP